MRFSGFRHSGLSAVVTFVATLFCACIGSTERQTEPADVDTLQADSTDNVDETDELLLYDAEPEPVTADMLFADFLYAFINDSHYQQQRIQFPIKSTDPDGEPISPEQWDGRGLMDGQEFYAIVVDRDEDLDVMNDTSAHLITVEQINLKESQLTRYHFSRNSGKFMLTTYDERAFDQVPGASFLHFYSQFATDTVFQREHVDFPLTLIVKSEDGDEDDSTELNADEWPEFRDQIPLPASDMTAIDYGQPVLSQNRKIMFIAGMSNGLFIKYKFDRTGDNWTLYEIEF